MVNVNEKLPEVLVVVVDMPEEDSESVLDRSRRGYVGVWGILGLNSADAGGRVDGPAPERSNMRHQRNA